MFHVYHDDPHPHTYTYISICINVYINIYDKFNLTKLKDPLFIAARMMHNSSFKNLYLYV